MSFYVASMTFNNMFIFFQYLVVNKSSDSYVGHKDVGSLTMVFLDDKFTVDVESSENPGIWFPVKLRNFKQKHSFKKALQ